MKKFTISEAFNAGVDAFKKNLGILIGMTLFVLFFQFFSNVLSEAGSALLKAYAGAEAAMVVAMSMVALVLSLISIIFSIAGFIVQMGYTKSMISTVDGNAPVFTDLFSQIKKFFRLLGASILVGLIVLGGLILLIVPGIMWGIKYCFTIQLIIDKDMKIMDAIKASGIATEGSKMDIFIFSLAMVGLIIAGMLLCGIGLIAAMPVTGVAFAFVYRKFFPANS